MSSVSSHAFSHSFGWKSYTLLKKKAMEQELSWSGLIISLSIAFFIVAGCAATLRMFVTSIEAAKNESFQKNERVIDSLYIVDSLFGIPTANAAAAIPYQAQVSKSTDFINITTGEGRTQNITYKNTGKTTWKIADVSFETGPYLRTFSKVQSASWKKFNEPVKLTKNVKPGESITISFPIKSPIDIEGTIQENFQLVVNDQPISGSLVRFFITISKPSSTTSTPASLLATTVSSVVAAPAVNTSNNGVLCIATTSESSTAYSDCNTNRNETNAGNGVISNSILANQPSIRVGLFSTLAPQRLTMDQVFDVYSANQIVFSDLPAGTIVTVSYNQVSKQYSVVTSTTTRFTNSYIRLVPKTNNAIATVLDYRANQKPQDNRFRNIIEYRYTEPAKVVWLINELPIEDYVKGLAETTNASPVEFQKVMATIARSYALYHYFRGVTYGVIDGSTKHASDHFHIDSVYDQVYRGYNSELRLTGLSQAVEATRGVVVTYNSKPVITPYFSNSDGRTRDWTEVWGSTVMPWLKSVTVIQDTGKNLFGHGVGLSARGALLMVNEGQAWQNILKYFYTGTEVRKIY
jgi:hypothetical protein